MFSQAWRFWAGTTVLGAPFGLFFILLAVDPASAGFFAGSLLARVTDPPILIGILLAGIAGTARRHFGWALGIGLLIGVAGSLLGYGWWSRVAGNAVAGNMVATFVVCAILLTAYGYIAGRVLTEACWRLTKPPLPNGAQVNPRRHADGTDKAASNNSPILPSDAAFGVSRADYYPLISRGVAALGASTKESRAALYERARAAQLNELGKRKPRPSDVEIERERAALENAIRTVEIDEAIKRRRLPNSPSGDVQEKTAGGLPAFVFTDNDAGREAFFKLQCKFGNVEVMKGKGMTALVLDASRECPGIPHSVKTEPDGRQLALLKVVSEDGGFIVTATTPSSEGDSLKPGDFVAWVPDALVEVPFPDKRTGWVGLIRAKIDWMKVGTAGEFKLICRYD